MSNRYFNPAQEWSAAMERISQKRLLEKQQEMAGNNRIDAIDSRENDNVIHARKCTESLLKRDPDFFKKISQISHEKRRQLEKQPAIKENLNLESQ